MEKQKDKLSRLFANLNVDATSDVSTEKLRTGKYLDKINNLVETVKKAEKNISLLEASIKFAQKLSWKSGDVMRSLNSMKESLQNVQLNELNDEYWKPYQPLLQLSASLGLVMQSFTFRNVAQACLEENSSASYNTVANDDMTRLHSLFKFLSTVGIQRFDTEWRHVLHHPDSQTVKTLQTLLGKPNDENSRGELDKEFSILEKHLKLRRSPKKVKLYIEDYMKYQHVLTQVNDLVHLLETLAIMKHGNALVAQLTSFADRFKYDEGIVLHDLHEPLLKVNRVISQYMEKVDDVIVELGQSHELIDFITEIVNEDIRLLIDAVEEHSDSIVKESLVSMFIQVHGFLAPLIKKCRLGFDPEFILMEVVRQCKDQKDMSMKIRQCSESVHSLKCLYQSVANREEMTKEIIDNCLKKGKFDISVDEDGICQITMTYRKDGGNNVTKKSMSELHDLRSRAHLISSDKRSHEQSQDDKEKQDINYVDFIEQVNLLSEIEEAIGRLQSSGYIKYRNGRPWPTKKGTQSLQELKDNLHAEINEWEDNLRDARQQFYFLNYFWSDQLCVLYDFLTNPNRDEVDFEDVLTLIHFVDPTIEEEHLREYGRIHSTHNHDSSQDKPNEIVSTIGNALNEIFENTFPVPRRIFHKETVSSYQQQVATVTRGELYVAVLNKESKLNTVNVILSLYENTSDAYPEPCQIVFCDPNKQWKEIELFLQRCFAPRKQLEHKSLFCLADVELIESEVQFKLIDFIKQKQKDNSDYQLAIICRGGDHHHIVQEFSKFCHHIPGMSYPEVSERLRSTWPDVKFVTSTLPGLGKTEFIRNEALEQEMNVVTFPISGQLDQSKIIQRLKHLHLKRFQCLHFDIGEVDDPVMLDTFLFQLIVTGMVSCETQLYRLRNTRVYIEIANSLNDRLRESLLITRCFNCVELQWNNYEDLQVSSKVTSNIQVVCQYLDVFDRDRLDSTDIHFFGQQKVKPLPTTRCREFATQILLN